MAKKVGDRYASMAELAAALGDYLNSGAPQPRTDPTSASLRLPETTAARVPQPGENSLVGQFFGQLRLDVEEASSAPLRPTPGPGGGSTPRAAPLARAAAPGLGGRGGCRGGAATGGGDLPDRDGQGRAGHRDCRPRRRGGGHARRRAGDDRRSQDGAKGRTAVGRIPCRVEGRPRGAAALDGHLHVESGRAGDRARPAGAVPALPLPPLAAPPPPAPPVDSHRPRRRWLPKRRFPRDPSARSVASQGRLGGCLASPSHPMVVVSWPPALPSRSGTWGRGVRPSSSRTSSPGRQSFPRMVVARWRAVPIERSGSGMRRAAENSAASGLSRDGTAGPYRSRRMPDRFCSASTIRCITTTSIRAESYGGSQGWAKARTPRSAVRPSPPTDASSPTAWAGAIGPRSASGTSPAARSCAGWHRKRDVRKSLSPRTAGASSQATSSGG